MQQGFPAADVHRTAAQVGNPPENGFRIRRLQVVLWTVGAAVVQAVAAPGDAVVVG